MRQGKRESVQNGRSTYKPVTDKNKKLDVVHHDEMKAIDEHPEYAEVIRELVDEEDIPADFEPPKCADCGRTITPNDIHAGLEYCFWCDPPWSPTEG